MESERIDETLLHAGKSVRTKDKEVLYSELKISQFCLIEAMFFAEILTFGLFCAFRLCGIPSMMMLMQIL